MKKADYQELCDDLNIDYADDATVPELKALLAEYEPPKGHVKTVHDGSIVIDMIVTTADGVPHERNITIKNPRGCILASQVTDPDYVISTLKDELVGRFGANHIA